MELLLQQLLQLSRLYLSFVVVLELPLIHYRDDPHSVDDLQTHLLDCLLVSVHAAQDHDQLLVLPIDQLQLHPQHKLPQLLLLYCWCPRYWRCGHNRRALHVRCLQLLPLLMRPKPNTLLVSSEIKKRCNSRKD